VNLLDHYDGLLVDIWAVITNGGGLPFSDAVRLRSAEHVRVVLFILTPMRRGLSKDIYPQLRVLRFRVKRVDTIITSGGRHRTFGCKPT